MTGMYTNYITLGGSWAAIFTALVAVFGYGKYLFEQRGRRRRLERYLKREKAKAGRGQRSTFHLIAKLGMTEAEILKASFQSKRVVRRVGVDKETGLANAILFEWDGHRPRQ